MTKFKVVKDNAKYIIEIKGHADYSDEGYDIVCAGISMAVSMTFNLIDKFGLSYNIKNQKVDKGNVLIETDMSDSRVVTIMDNLVDCLCTLEVQYPKNIKNVK